MIINLISLPGCYLEARALATLAERHQRGSEEPPAAPAGESPAT